MTFGSFTVDGAGVKNTGRALNVRAAAAMQWAAGGTKWASVHEMQSADLVHHSEYKGFNEIYM